MEMQKCINDVVDGVFVDNNDMSNPLLPVGHFFKRLISQVSSYTTAACYVRDLWR